eukprot:evm.model.scf_1521.1 EVM.evm.TU.scf_1521.1   scf_1521:4755-16016(-)
MGAVPGRRAFFFVTLLCFGAALGAWGDTGPAESTQPVCPKGSSDGSRLVLTLRDDMWASLDGNLQGVVDCLEDEDVLLFNTSQPLMPRNITIITKSIAISTYTNNASFASNRGEPLVFPEVERKTTLTCSANADHEGLFELRAEGIVLANVIVENCQLNAGPNVSMPGLFKSKGAQAPVTVAGCEPGGQPVKLLHSIFRNNSNGNSSGGVKVFPGCSVQMENLEFSNNTSNGSGAGAIIGGFTTMQNVKFRYNAAKLYGGGVNIEDATLEANNATFESNTAALEGGGLKATNSRTFFRNTTFMRNLAAWGGALFTGPNTFASMSSTNWTRNEAAKAGGAIAANSSTTIITGNRFFQNRALSGGAIYASDGHPGRGGVGPPPLLNISASTIERNTGWAGGGVYIEGLVRCQLNNTNVSHNGALLSGGGLHLAHGDGLVIENSHFTENNADNSGGGLYVVLRWAGVNGPPVPVAVNRSTFTGNYAFYGGGGALLTSAATLGENCYNGPGKRAAAHEASNRIVSCHFVDNEASTNGGGLLLSNIEASLEAVNFTDNTADMKGGRGGGAFIGEFTKAEFVDVVFEENVAFQGGGLGIMPAADEEAVCMTSLVCTECLFRSNTAQSMGGAIWTQGSPEVSLPSSFVEANGSTTSGTTAIFLSSPGLPAVNCSKDPTAGVIASLGANVSCKDVWGPPKHIEADRNTVKVSRRVEFAENITITIKDGFGHVLADAYSSSPLFVLATSNDDIELRGQTAAQIISGMANFTSLAAVPKGKTVRGEVYFVFDGIVSNATVQLEFSDCQPGEIQDRGRCIGCLRGHYSFNPDNTTCDKCPKDALCLASGVVVPIRGSWHSHPQSVQIHDCLRRDACDYGNRSEKLSNYVLSHGVGIKVSQVYQNLLCSPGYEGVLCASCSGGHGFREDGKCSKCMDSKAAEWTIMLAKIAVVLCGVYILTKCHLSTAGHCGSIWKVIFSYLQVTGLAWLLKLEWPTSVEVLFRLQDLATNIDSGPLPTLGCILSGLGGSQQIARPAVLIAFPLVLMLLATLSWCALSRRPLGIHSLEYQQRCEAPIEVPTEERSISRPVAITISAILFLMYPAWSRAVLSIMDCVSVDSNDSGVPYVDHAHAVGSYWAMGTRSKCFRGEHLVLASILVPIGLLFVSFPLWLSALLRRHKAAEDFRRKYGFWYAAYKHDSFYWESVVLTRKLLMVVVLVFGDSLAVQKQNIVVLGALIVAFGAHVWRQPFEGEDVNMLESLSLTASFMTFFLGSFIEGTISVGWRTACSVAIFGLNLALGYRFFVALRAARREQWVVDENGSDSQGLSDMIRSIAAGSVEMIVRRVSMIVQQPTSSTSNEASSIPRQ